MIFLSGVTPYNVYSDNNILRNDIRTYFSRLSDSEINTLIESGMIEWVPSSVEDFRFIPDIPFRNEILNRIRQLDFNIATECLFFIPYRKIKDSKQSVLIDSFSIATSIEKLSGIKYYSVSQRGERVLFERAEIISGRVSHPVTIVPPVHLIIAQIEDSTLGSNRYRIEYNSSSDFLVMKMSNMERLSFGFIPVIGREALLFYIVIIPTEQGFLLYSNGIGKTMNTGFLRRRVTQSVHNRVVALYNWFKESYSSL
ncbi:MAG: hypothetical protein FWD87_04835 [Spirochaetaceae bacterium]|nr:hypothetical protein [Spirochaetaceae bacterium]